MYDTTTSTSVEEPPGSCTLCALRDPHRPPVCNPCRSRLARLVTDLRLLHDQIRDEQQAAAVEGAAYWQALDWNTRQKGDPVGHRRDAPLTRRGLPVFSWDLPAGPIPAAPNVSRIHRVPPGSRPPMALDGLDLTSAARQGSYGPQARGALGTDEYQGGHLPLATALDSWARRFIEARGQRERQPAATVEALTRWLGDRVEWACDEYADVDEFAADLLGYQRTLRTVLGVSARPEYKDGVPCPRCRTRTLIRKITSEYVECDTCQHMMTVDEYEAWVRDEGRDLEQGLRTLLWALLVTAQYAARRSCLRS